MRRPSADYLNPIGGKSRLIVPGLAIHSCPFTLGGLAFGARSTACQLNGPDKPIAIVAPIPYGAESENMLRVLSGGPGPYNIKYIILTNIVHHMGAASWKEKFPDVKIVGVRGVCRKKEREGIKIDYIFEEKHGNRIIDGPLEDLDLPEELTNTLSLFHLPGHKNKELIAYHKPSKTIIESDLLVNFPAYEQYEGSEVSPVGGFSNILRFMTASSWLTKLAMGRVFDGEQWPVTQATLQSAWELGIERIICSHGDVLEGEEASKTFAQAFGLKKDVKPPTSSL
jgi:hypothetical protein